MQTPTHPILHEVNGKAVKPIVSANLPMDVILDIIARDHIIQFAFRQTCKEMMNCIISPDVRDDITEAARIGDIAQYDMLMSAYNPVKQPYKQYNVGGNKITIMRPADAFMLSDLSTDALKGLISRNLLKANAIGILASTDRSDAGELTTSLLVAIHPPDHLAARLLQRALNVGNAAVAAAIYAAYPTELTFVASPTDDHRRVEITDTMISDSLCPRNIDMLRWYLDHGAVIPAGRLRRARCPEVIAILGEYGVAV